jgi:CDP-diacylglycerol--glycerol-3-phosphate 3-phosphatidyltransferase
VPHHQLHLHDSEHPLPGLWPLTWPMGLTMLRLLLLPVFLWLILDAPHAGARTKAERLTALIIFALMALTDKLDGYLARKLNQVSRLGTLLDPVADKLLVACSVILLSFDWIASPRLRIPMAVVGIIYGGYIIVAIGTLALLVSIGKVSIKPRPLGKANTFLQLVLVILTLIALVVRPELSEGLRKVLVVLWWVVPIAAVLTCGDYVVQGFSQRSAGRDRKSLENGI